MAQNSQFTVRSGTVPDMELIMSTLGKEGWRPILMNTLAGRGANDRSTLFIIFEKVAS